MNNVETWVVPLAATNQYTQYYANVQTGTYIPYNSTSAKPSFFDKLCTMIESRDAIDTLFKNGAINEEDYKRILNNIRLQEMEGDQMIQVETHLYCAPYYQGHYWIDLVVDGKVIKTADNISKDEIDSYNKQLEKYANKHKELIKNMLVADIKLEEFNELYHIKLLSSKKWKEISDDR